MVRAAGLRKEAGDMVERDEAGAAPELVIPVLREEAHVSKRRSVRGGVRLRKRVSQREEPVEASLAVETLEVRRVAVGRVVPLAEAPQARHEGDTLVVPVLEEVMVLEKRIRIKEELHITRHVHQEAYSGTVTLRAEQLEVERLGDEAGATTTDGGSHHATHTRSRL
jgi:uncharacterized protein (TIGR02271 family)